MLRPFLLRWFWYEVHSIYQQWSKIRTAIKIIQVPYTKYWFRISTSGWTICEWEYFKVTEAIFSLSLLPNYILYFQKTSKGMGHNILYFSISKPYSSISFSSSLNHHKRSPLSRVKNEPEKLHTRQHLLPPPPKKSRSYKNTNIIYWYTYTTEDYNLNLVSSLVVLRYLDRNVANGVKKPISKRSQFLWPVIL